MSFHESAQLLSLWSSGENHSASLANKAPSFTPFVAAASRRAMVSAQLQGAVSPTYTFITTRRAVGGWHTTASPSVMAAELARTLAAPVGAGGKGGPARGGGLGGGGLLTQVHEKATVVPAVQFRPHPPSATGSQHPGGTGGHAAEQSARPNRSHLRS